MIPMKSPGDIKRMRQSGRIAADVLMALEDRVRPGVTTAEMDRTAHDLIVKAGGDPSFLGYGGFPASICASLNEQVVHGIPSDDCVLRDGDIISVDVGVLYKGFHGDNARTYAVGTVAPETTELLKVTRECLSLGLAEVRAGAQLGAMSHAVQAHAEEHGFGVVRQFAGHGIGERLHEEPHVPNYGKPNDGPELRAGMALAIEPMINAGTHRVRTLDDGWTVVTADGRPSAHFEHTVVVLSDGVEILTNWDAATT
ncbi:type I methionyl aminopeptidase [Candidatus Poribacteria bacterium]|nr:type I methionyl aminopeptidase [Candidatus Poribacteria bacterium]